MCNLSLEKVRLLFECSFQSSAAFTHNFTVLICLALFAIKIEVLLEKGLRLRSVQGNQTHPLNILYAPVVITTTHYTVFVLPRLLICLTKHALAGFAAARLQTRTSDVNWMSMASCTLRTGTKNQWCLLELIRTFLKLNECLDFFNERTIERSFHHPLSGKPCTHCSRTKVMKCVDLHSVVLSKINACVLERNVVCSVNRLEKSRDWHAMIREKFCFQSGTGLGVVQVNAVKA